MKNLPLPLLMLLLLTACEMENVLPLENDPNLTSVTALKSNGAGIASNEAEIILIDNLIDQITEMMANGEIGNGPGNSILSKLNSIKKKLEQGKTEVALSKLAELIAHMEDLAAQGTAGITEELIEAVEFASCKIDLDCCNVVFDNGCLVPNVCISDNSCFATVTLPLVIIDCNNIDLTVTSDLGIGFGPFDNVAPGTYGVTYTVEDNNNQTACATALTVVDCKKPTPNCKNGIVVELMDVEPAVVGVSVSDLNDNSFDNCAESLQFSFSSNINNTNRTFACDDLGQNTVEMWVTDGAGNQDFCVTSVIIMANMGQCD